MIPIEQISATYGHPMGVVIQACRVYFGSINKDALQSILQVSDEDWNSVAKLARQHRIRPIVFRVLLSCTLPDHIRKVIDAELRMILRDELSRTSETIKKATLLQQNGIEALPYKGITYSYEFYGAYGMRESSDMDFAIDRNQVPEADRLLSTDNYFSDEKDYYHYLGHDLYVRRNRGYNFKKDDQGSPYLIEMHWGMLEDHNLVSGVNNEFHLEEKKLFDDKAHAIYTLNKFEHFKAVYLHHTVQEGLTYLKTAIDITQALPQLSQPTNGNEKKILTDLIRHHRLEQVACLSYRLFGVRSLFMTNSKTTFSRIEKFPFLLQLRSIKKQGTYTFLNYFSYHIRLLWARIFFIQGTIPALLFLIKAIGRILKYDIDDYKWIRLPRKLIFLYNLARPIRKFFFPTNPLLR
ncbi:MAG: nucleotidyltransferase family protein [Sphingomonadales bacterium]